MFLGVNPLGIFPLGIEGAAVSLITYSEVNKAVLLIGSNSTNNALLNSYDAGNLRLAANFTTSASLNSDEDAAIYVAATYRQSETWAYLDERAPLIIKASDVTSSLSDQPGVAVLITEARADTSSSIGEITPVSLVFSTQTYQSYYTFNIQEYDAIPAKLTLGGNSVDLYVPNGTIYTDIPQVWIG
jgi:hypothetical protein